MTKFNRLERAESHNTAFLPTKYCRRPAPNLSWSWGIPEITTVNEGQKSSM
jgi:hypothetical protein